MQALDLLCKKYNIALCYILGSLQDVGKALLEGKQVTLLDPESDIDVAVLFKIPPEKALMTYARISIDLQDIMTPFKVDLLFLHEVDHLVQLEAIKGTNVYTVDEQTKDEYEHMVMMFAADEHEIFKRNERDLFEAIRDGYFEFEYKAADK